MQGKALIPALFIISALGVVMLRGGFIFMLLALLPAIMAYFMDSDANKSAFKTVLACNFSATMPTLAPMVKAVLQGKPLEASTIMSNPSTWLFVYSGAAAGWCLIFLCRWIARFFIIVSYEYKVIALERMKKRLEEEWGTQIKL